MEVLATSKLLDMLDVLKDLLSEQVKLSLLRFLKTLKFWKDFIITQALMLCNNSLEIFWVKKIFLKKVKYFRYLSLFVSTWEKLHIHFGNKFICVISCTKQEFKFWRQLSNLQNWIEIQYGLWHYLTVVQIIY